MRETKNPALRDSIFEQFENSGSLAADDRMTVKGAAQKTGLLLMIVFAAAIWGWNLPNIAFLMGSWVITVGLSFLMGFKPQTAPWAAPLWAVIQGVAVGTLSRFADEMLKDSKYPGAVPLAVAGTFVAFGVMLALYAFKIFRLNETGRNMVIGMTAALMVFYLITGILSFFMPQAIAGISLFGSGPIGIAFSVFAIGLACFNFLVDFWAIESRAQQGMPKFMEWFCAFGLTFTIVWLYIELLRLFMKLARR